MQDELQPFKKQDSNKGKVSAECVTDARAARAWAQTLLAGMDKPDADAMQALWSNMVSMLSVVCKSSCLMVCGSTPDEWFTRLQMNFQIHIIKGLLTPQAQLASALVKLLSIDPTWKIEVAFLQAM